MYYALSNSTNKTQGIVCFFSQFIGTEHKAIIFTKYKPSKSCLYFLAYMHNLLSARGEQMLTLYNDVYSENILPLSFFVLEKYE